MSNLTNHGSDCFTYEEHKRKKRQYGKNHASDSSEDELKQIQNLNCSLATLKGCFDGQKGGQNYTKKTKSTDTDSTVILSPPPNVMDGHDFRTLIALKNKPLWFSGKDVKIKSKKQEKLR